MRIRRVKVADLPPGHRWAIIERGREVEVLASSAWGERLALAVLAARIGR